MSIRTLPPAPQRREILISDFAAGNPWVAAGLGGSTNLAVANSAARFGPTYASIVTNGAGGTGTITATGMPPWNPATTPTYVRIWVSTQDMQRLADLQIRCGDAGGIAAGRYWEWAIANNITILQGAGQQEIRNDGQVTGVCLSLGDATKVGAAFLTPAMTEWQIMVRDRNSARTVQVHGIEIMREASTGGRVAITMDDSAATQYTIARHSLANAGVQATIFPIIDALGSGPQFLTQTQLALLANDRHEIGVHSYSKWAHDNWTSLPPSEQASDLDQALTWSDVQGYAGDTFAYPQGWYHSPDGARARFIGCRTVANRPNMCQPLPPTDPYRVRSLSSVGGLGAPWASVTALTSVGGILDRVASNNTSLTLCFHTFTTGVSTSATECSEADFDTILTAINNKGIQVVPFHQIIRGG